MKTLTVTMPWAWWIASGDKRLENRSWTTTYRGPLLIHAGKMPRRAEFEAACADVRVTFAGAERPLIPTWEKCMALAGRIVALVRLEDCYSPQAARFTLPDDERVWWRWGQYAWLLRAATPMTSEVRMGRLGLWEWDLGAVAVHERRGDGSQGERLWESLRQFARVTRATSAGHG